MNKNPESAEDAGSVVYQVRLPLSARVVTFVAGVIRALSKALGTRWLQVGTGRQAVIALAICCSWRSPTAGAAWHGFLRPRPGGSSDITVARGNDITAKLREAGLGAICDLGFVGLDDDPADPVIIIGKKPARKHH
ncbi:hypothetical protein ABH935_009921 [Catenulispora sp. GAS73]|uniref:hypothetical protein n=1 Tax=Catenulispora sp. GAS73 TaxID=3156269 RepID=UPI0035182E76